MWMTPTFALIGALGAALGGALVAVLLDTLRSVFAVRARNRQERVERCARLVQAAAQVKALGSSLSYAHRRNLEGNPVKADELDETQKEYNSNRGELEIAALLLRLGGPDHLADAAESVRAAADVQGRIKGDADKFDESLEELGAATLRFANTARKFAR